MSETECTGNGTTLKDPVSDLEMAKLVNLLCSPEEAKNISSRMASELGMRRDLMSSLVGVLTREGIIPQWIRLDDQQFPVKGQFLAGWFDEDVCESVELLAVNGDVFYNFNSGNMNSFNVNTFDEKRPSIFTHWMHLPSQ